MHRGMVPEHRQRLQCCGEQLKLCRGESAVSVIIISWRDVRTVQYIHVKHAVPSVKHIEVGISPESSNFEPPQSCHIHPFLRPDSLNETQIG